MDGSAWDPLFEGLPTLDPVSALSCEGDIVYEECERAISSMQKGKSPGSDGLPAEFYVKFFPLFGDEFVKVINRACAGGEIYPPRSVMG